MHRCADRSARSGSAERADSGAGFALRNISARAANYNAKDANRR
jgi:hypothetical protein